MIQTIEITDEQKEKILHLSENHFNDLKSKDISPASLTKTISAFSNSVGGDLYIGIDENEEKGIKTRSWRGFVDEEEANGHIQIFEQLFPIGDSYSYTFLTNPSSTGLILQASIKKTLHIVKASNGSIYKRRSAQSLKLTTDAELKRLELDKGLSSFEDITLNIPLETVTDSYIIFEFMIEVVPTIEPLPWLKKQLLIRDNHPTVAATLLYSEIPQAALPKQSGIKVYRYKTKSDEGTRETLVFDPISIEGPIYTQIYEAVSTTKRVIEEEKVLRETGLEDLQYPDKALHEIVTNAVLHRDYSLASDIHIRIFDNRVEVLSPGSLPGHVTEINILNEQFARNGNLVRLVNKFPNPPNKDVGEGLNTAFNETSDLRLKKPIIKELENAVLVTISHEPLASPEKIIMEYLETNDEIHNSTARELTGVRTPDSMKSVFYKLQEKGLLEINPDPTKKGRNSTWIKKK
ncbi:ATP-binding protein [Flavobacterium seoulense]|uniref:ATP-dependent DNA helicase RecG n=1 Tax=Flavobacterium seoulense TaxID=1492738 RepID=A0A066WUN5_9FLAO|nr:ATP-binding protein [Flavobacterium seoulense]KDN54340.1 ATP-dependent DNA helicase RecG [Flavobacterium seoulense]